MRDDFSLKECMIMIKIKDSNLGDPLTLTITRLANICEVSVTNKRLWNVLRYLFDEGIILHTSQIGSSKIISVKKSKLEEVIECQKILIPIFEYYENNNIVL